MRKNGKELQNCVILFTQDFAELLNGKIMDKDISNTQDKNIIEKKRGK